MTHLVEVESVPTSVACEVIDLPRSSWYYVGRTEPDPEERVIEDFLRDCVARRPRRGFGKCFSRARRMGYAWNHKRVYRIYKQLGLNLRRPGEAPPAGARQAASGGTAVAQCRLVDGLHE